MPQVWPGLLKVQGLALGVRGLRWLDRLHRRISEPMAQLRQPPISQQVHLDLASPACRIHLPRGPGPHPAVLLVPGALDGASAVEGRTCVLTAPRLARRGIATLVFSPAGREGVPGREDFCGPRHQEDCARALQALLSHRAVCPDRVAVVSISFGLVMAMGALVTHPELARQVRVFIDWEGPGSRRWFRPPVHPSRHSAVPGFWDSREAVRMAPALRCPYWRFQSRWDHVHGFAPEIGREMVRAAVGGGCPEVRLNATSGPLDEGREQGWPSVLISHQNRVLIHWLQIALGMGSAAGLDMAGAGPERLASP